MSYLSLYRKYRSQSFEDLAGQEHVTRTLQNAVRAGRVAHAYLFSGPRGTGKTSSARLLARALNCERGPTPTPCGECDSCREIRDGISPTVVEIDAASSRGIDEVRELRQRAMTVPSQPGARKVFIVDEVHMLTTEACNALLKTLEEPPAHVVFVLATTDAQKLPATILSRCQRFEFRRGSVSLIGERIRYVAEAEGSTIEPEAVRLVARASGGSWRDAISLLEQVLSYGGPEISAAQVAAVLGAVAEESLFELAEGLAGASGQIVYPIIEALISAGTEPRQLARDLGEHFRALLMADAGALPVDEYSPDTARRLVAQAARFGTGRLVAALEALAQAEKEMRWSDSGRVVLEVALARLMLAPAATSQPAAHARAAEKPVAAGRVAERPVPSVSAPPAAAPVSIPDQPRSTLSGGLAAEPAKAGFVSTDRGFNPGLEQPGSPSSTAAIGLDQVRERWNVVTEELKRKRSPQAHALLTEAQPLRCDGTVLVLGFRYSGHRDLWERGDNKARLSAALDAVLGQPLQVRSEVLGDDPPGAAGPVPSPPPANPAAPRPSATAGAAAPASDSLEGEALVHEVIALFEGQIVDAPG